MLWNILFEDVALAVRAAGFTEAVYADDLNAFRYDTSTANQDTLEDASLCQTGQRVGTGKPSRIQSSQRVYACRVTIAQFKMLGVQSDCRLKTGNAVEHLVGDVRWRARSVLRAQRFHSTMGMRHLYKSKVFHTAEYRTSAVCP